MACAYANGLFRPAPGDLCDRGLHDPLGFTRAVWYLCLILGSFHVYLLIPNVLLWFVCLFARATVTLYHAG